MQNSNQKFTNARLMAVQAVYARELSDESWEKTVSRFLMGEAGGVVIKDGIAGREEYITIEAADASLFTNLVQAVKEHEDILTDVIKNNISDKIDFDRLEILIKCILKVGMAEFYVNPNLDTPIIINEYTDMTHAFFDGPESRLVNAILDKYARIIRS
ncbi:MAG: hypothetical protein IJY58_05190 [Alphaproteobacteria bacterium]|nr:hypothetical protein [Alphaproteobacteria bacterium]